MDSDQIVDLSIDTGDIADDAINNDKITINAVDSTQLQDGSVTNNKLAGSITDDKLNQITNKVHNSATTANSN